MILLFLVANKLCQGIKRIGCGLCTQPLVTAHGFGDRFKNFESRSLII